MLFESFFEIFPRFCFFLIQHPVDRSIHGAAGRSYSYNGNAAHHPENADQNNIFNIKSKSHGLCLFCSFHTYSCFCYFFHLSPLGHTVNIIVAAGAMEYLLSPVIQLLIIFFFFYPEKLSALFPKLRIRIFFQHVFQQH